MIAGPAAAVLRAVQRAGTFTAEDLGESGDPEAPATPATRLREVLAKAYVDVGAWADGAVEALWAELSRRELSWGGEGQARPGGARGANPRRRGRPLRAAGARARGGPN